MSPSTQAQPNLTSDEIRVRFLRFFAQREHAVVESAPLVPDDPTLLFVNAGMVPFKDTFLGLEERDYRRAASAQRCMRVSGKHNDLENVGPSPRHHTFFEMLGNFSFGDYFKPEAIRFAHNFLVEELGVDPERLVYTVFHQDPEARRIWVEDIGIPDERVLDMGEATNFWMMADVGPCGPTSEIHYDFGPEACTCGDDACSVLLDNDCERWLEVWNLVFMQYDQGADGTRRPLPQTGVDTGMGLERVTAVMQDAAANYDTDLFQPIVERIQQLAEHDPKERDDAETGYRVLADHGRAMTFLIADGVLPGNEGRGYVLRLIMRRAMRYGRLIGFEGPFLVPITDAVVKRMGDAYPKLRQRQDWIAEVVAEEESRFARTLSDGLAMLDERIAELREEDATRIPGQDVFRLYDTFGFPPDLTRVVAEERGLSIDRAGFEAAMAEQRERARAGGRFDVADAGELYRRLELAPTTFTGHDATEGEGELLALVVDGQPTERAGAGTSVEIVLDRSPFYAEAGGQVGDMGWMDGPHGRVRVENTIRPVAGITVHHGRVEEGAVAVGEQLHAKVDAERRADIMRNHTATHLLHDALQQVLGEHAQQRGSLVAPDRLRFDFAHLKGLEQEELAEVERRVNAAVRSDAAVRWQEMSMDEAKAAGATMLFGEKYGDEVRVVEIEGVSMELCGGTHLSTTGAIGSFLITGEGSVGAGLRRIEALTGRAAEQEARRRGHRLEHVAELLGLPTTERIEERLGELLEERRQLGRDLESARAKLAAGGADALVARAVDVGGVPLVAAKVEAAEADALRTQLDAVRDALGPGVVVLGAMVDDKPRLVAAVDDSLVGRGLHAGKLVKILAERLGGGGGGRPTLAEAGGRDGDALPAALDAAAELVRVQLEAGAS